MNQKVSPGSVPSDLRRMGRDLLVWMIAGAATAQTFAQGIQGLLDRRPDHFLLYLTTSALLLLVAASIERIKGFLEPS